MPLKGNQFKSNSFKQENGASNGKQKEDSEKRPKEKKHSFLVLQNGRFIKIVGLLFLILSLYFLVAFTSYLFTWQDDQSYVIDANGGWNNLFKGVEELKQNGVKDTIVENWLGKLGALLSHQFIYKWFGVASFLFIFVFFVIGYRMLFKVKIFAVEKVLAYGFFFLVFLSLTFGFARGFFTETPHWIEGEFGFWTNKLLIMQIGQTGVGGLIVFLGLTILIIAYNIDFRLPERQSGQIGHTPLSDFLEKDEVINEEKPKPVEFELNNRLDPEYRREQNLILTPNRFDNRPKESANEALAPTSPLAVNAMLDSNLSQKSQPKSVQESMPAKNLELDVTAPVKEKLADEPAFTVEKTEEEVKAEELVEQFGNYDPTLDLSGYKYPHLDLLENYGSNKISINAEELEANKNKIVETLNHYNIEIDKIKATVGPTVTLYEIIPAPGVRISKIKNLEDDIALSLAALGIRIIAPMPGKGTIGIEVPNSHPEMVAMRSVIGTEKFRQTIMDLPIALGKTISNEVFIADLAKMPHLLVAGATGQGKSVGINSILVSLLYKKHPSQLKLVLVDPKKVELTLFNKIERHFLAKLPGGDDAIITDIKKVINTLNSLCIEMDQRYDLLKDAQVRNLKEYNDKFIKRKLNPNNGHRFLPYIVLVIDEFADLMMTAGKEIETPIARLAQLARAIGIHLVLATQRPSVNVITGTIKANFPARLAFRVLSKIDSRTILDSGGADQLIGRGDMLLATGSDLIRLQCAFVDTPEVDRISDFIGRQRGYPDAYQLPEYIDENGEGGLKEFDPDDKDPLFEEAARLIITHQQGSTSLIQRKMKLGYNRAGRIIDQLEGAGIVGPFEGSKAREVLIADEYELEQFLNNLSNK